jgi:alkanesulfonate monooxygenase SsuD/methylene tetrahydromethanopterin reductase-like flavin-dependent oxidoreductase (luciferase family)
MEIDVILDARASAKELAELGRLAEDVGIRGVWVSSLLDSRDPFTNLSVLAQSTSRLRVGPVAVNPFDTHPVKIAASFLTLNELAGGRARIVIGGGGEALEALGIEPARRVRAVAECVDIIKGAASGEAVNYAGELYTVRNLRLNWLEAETPPVFVGASMEQMLRMSARVADGIMMSDMPASLAAAAIQTLDRGLAGNGKRRPAFQTNGFAAWHVYADREQALREARQWLVLRGIFRPWVLREFLDGAETDLVMSSRSAFWDAFRSQNHVVDGIPDSVLNRMVENLTFVGSVDDLDGKIEKLRAFGSAGLGSIALRLYQDPAASIRLLGERVLPELR